MKFKPFRWEDEMKVKRFRWYLAKGYKLSQVLRDVRDHGIRAVRGTTKQTTGLREAWITITVEYGRPLK